MTYQRMWQQCKNIYHVAQAMWWRAWYGFPDRRLRLFGVTGTNGKTTTSYILRGILAQEYGEKRVGMLTTVAFRVGAKEVTNDTKMTTLPSHLVFSYLHEMVEQGVKAAVLEMTSHALDQRRLFGVKLAGAIILNIEREHLDYHATIAEYAAAKELIAEYLEPNAPLVGKADDIYVGPMLMRAKQRGLNVVEFTEKSAADFNTPLAGAVNKQNALAASLLATKAGISPTAVARGVETVRLVPGRMETLQTKGGFMVVIDYAVTTDALERLYRDVRQRTSGKVYGVLGAAGRRDRGKRPLMAAAVKKYADELIITREDPWDEDEKQIFSDLEKGLPAHDPSWRRIVDRREALTFALRHATQGDAVVVTGKGAEVGMAVGGHNVVPWKEREVVEGILRERYG